MRKIVALTVHVRKIP